MVGKAAVAFLDILGYKKIIEKGIENKSLIPGIEKIVKISLGLLRKSGEKSEPDRKDGWNTINEVTSARFISDNAIFTLNLSKIPVEDPRDISGYFHIYLSYISSFYLTFVAKIGCIQRGGLSIGTHYENADNGHLFIFSEAYVNAYELERKDKGKPIARIIIDRKLFSYLESIHLKDMGRFFYKDKDDEMCFEPYCFLDPSQGDDTLDDAKRILEDIKKALIVNMGSNRGDDKVLGKLQYFIEHHNKTVSKYGDEFKEFLIDMNIFDK
ncbi:MAG: hypothetical protein KAU58_04650 [Candidatus Omnitrophica bacterium]|nr:hypothetical protein [Candidatus Omnitrophota bacterium]